MLRLSIDARVVTTDTRGIGRYERAVLRRLLKRDDVEITLLAPGIFSSFQRPALKRTLGSTQFRIASKVPHNSEVVWHPANGTFFPSNAPSVVTIHDAVPFRYPTADLERREREQAPFLLSTSTATRVITPSAFGKSEVVEVFGVAPERVDVIHHGVEPSFSPNGSGSHDYFLFVGNPNGEPRKNYPLLAQAHKLAWPDGDGPEIRIAGGNVGDDLRSSENSEMRELYRNALALTIPSYHETFGMPIIEAMACGTPTIASRASCLPEIGGDASLYVDPHDAQAWANAMRRVASDAALREELRVRGLARARNFDWDRCTQEHYDLFMRVASAR